MSAMRQRVDIDNGDSNKSKSRVMVSRHREQAIEWSHTEKRCSRSQKRLHGILNLNRHCSRRIEDRQTKARREVDDKEGYTA